jgi:GH15 family glucan-1,4-alpha-glucosidase
MTSTETDRVEIPAQRSPMESPFPPITDYAFLSDCHTGALVAADGSVDWLCVPRFDSPSIFGSLLDRQAGMFRFAPYGINVPAARSYEPGSNTLTTTWMTPTGWVIVRDALVFGAYSEDDVVTPHSRPPTSYDAHHLLVRTMRCIEGFTQVDLVCEPVFDYGREPAVWTLVDGSRHRADAAGGGMTVRLHSDLALGVEGPRARARGLLREGEEVFCALSWAGDLAGPEDARRAQEALDATTQYWRMWLARARIPDHRYREHSSAPCWRSRG